MHLVVLAGLVAPSTLASKPVPRSRGGGHVVLPDFSVLDRERR